MVSAKCIQDGDRRVRRSRRKRGNDENKRRQECLSLVVGERGTPDPIVFLSRCPVVLMYLPAVNDKYLIFLDVKRGI